MSIVMAPPGAYTLVLQCVDHQAEHYTTHTDIVAFDDKGLPLVMSMYGNRLVPAAQYAQSWPGEVDSWSMASGFRRIPAQPGWVVVTDGWWSDEDGQMQTAVLPLLEWRFSEGYDTSAVCVDTSLHGDPLVEFSLQDREAHVRMATPAELEGFRRIERCECSVADPPA